MNVFLLHADPLVSAEYLVDDHCAFVTLGTGRAIRGCKMAIEAVQLLCTARNKYGASAPYKPTHHNHPWARYAASGADAYQLVRDHALAILLEHEYRTGRTLPSVQAALAACMEPPCSMPKLSSELIPVCRGGGNIVHVRTLDEAVQLYRAYYRDVKISRMPRYTRRDMPQW
jgi:hypothetical protein